MWEDRAVAILTLDPCLDKPCRPGVSARLCSRVLFNGVHPSIPGKGGGRAVAEFGEVQRFSPVLRFVSRNWRNPEVSPPMGTTRECGSLRFLYFHPFNKVGAIYLAVAFVLLFIIHGGIRDVSAANFPRPRGGLHRRAVTSRFRTIRFYEGYANLWGPQHQTVSRDQSSTTIWLDRSSGSGFKSLNAYKSGFFSAAIKLQAGYTAGVITAFYLSNNEAHPGRHDEIDVEFLGTTPGKPYTLQTNIYINGSGDGKILTGRELKFHLWFDPTADFHDYSVLWTPSRIVFYVDGVPIRRYPRRSASTYPLRPMWVYGSIWDASSWATEDGKYKADYRYAPFVARFTNFILSGCPASRSACSSRFSSSLISDEAGGGLTGQERATMKWVQKNYMVYNYCKDRQRYPHRLPECGKHRSGLLGISNEAN